MSIGRYVTGFVIILAVFGAAAVIGYAIRRRFLPDWRGAQARLAEIRRRHRRDRARELGARPAARVQPRRDPRRQRRLAGRRVHLAAPHSRVPTASALHRRPARTLGRSRRRRQRHPRHGAMGDPDDSRDTARLFRLRHPRLPPADGPALGADRGHRAGAPDRPRTAGRLLPRERRDLPRRRNGGVAERRLQPRTEPGMAAAGAARRLGDRPALERDPDRHGRYRPRVRRSAHGPQPAGQRHDRHPVDGTAAGGGRAARSPGRRSATRRSRSLVWPPGSRSAPSSPCCRCWCCSPSAFRCSTAGTAGVRSPPGRPRWWRAAASGTSETSSWSAIRCPRASSRSAISACRRRSSASSTTRRNRSCTTRRTVRCCASSPTISATRSAASGCRSSSSPSPVSSSPCFRAATGCNGCGGRPACWGC